MSEPRRVWYARTAYDEAEIQAVVEALRTSSLNLTGGPSVQAFEARVAVEMGHSYGIMVNSGSSAVLTALAIHDLPAGSEVITPALTFATTVSPVLQLGLRPAFVDVESDTYVVDVDRVEAMIGPRTSAILVPDLVGNVPDWARLQRIADAHAVALIEDSADTLGPTFAARPTGHYADTSIASFYASHLITCAGTGGLVATSDPERAARARQLRGWGRRTARNGETEDIDARLSVPVQGGVYDAKYVFDVLGYNFMPSELGAAFGLVQLGRLEAAKRARRANVRRHRELLGHWPAFYRLAHQREEVRTAWHGFAFTVHEDAPFSREALQRFLEGRGIQTRALMAGNILRQPAMRGRDVRVDAQGYPEADRVMRQGLMIGCHPSLEEADHQALAEAFEAWAARW